MRSPRLASLTVCLLMCVAAVQAADYPLALAASAQVSKGATTVTTTFTIRIDRVMNETFRTRVTDALKFGGYPKFLPALRALPAIGTIELEGRKVVGDMMGAARVKPTADGGIVVDDFAGQPVKLSVRRMP